MIGKLLNKKIFSMKRTKILFLQKNLKIKLNLRRGKKKPNSLMLSGTGTGSGASSCSEEQREAGVGGRGGEQVPAVGADCGEDRLIGLRVGVDW